MNLNIKDLTQEIIYGNGYVTIPNLISPQEAETARNLVLERAAKLRQLESVHDNRERVYGLIYLGETFEYLVQHPTLLSVIEAILGEDLILGGFSAHILHPGASSMGVHVDYPYWAMSSPFPKYPILEIQAIWLAQDFTENNGAPLFAAKTQQFATKPDVEQFERIAQKITGTAGTVIISHGLCWHSTSENTSDCSRVSLLGNYAAQFIRPLENNLFDYQPAVFQRATPKLKHLLRHDWLSPQTQALPMKFKMDFC
jgi:ectoine hydroxylase-related dioxygenase (phytanoyl-CoA dioxygenase family)